MSENADYLTVEEVAGHLRVAEPTVRVWINTGKLPAYRFGGKVFRVARTDLDAFLAESRIS